MNLKTRAYCGGIGVTVHWCIPMRLSTSVLQNCVRFSPISGGGVNRQEREVTLTLKHGVEAKNYDDVSMLCHSYLARNIKFVVWTQMWHAKGCMDL